MLVKACPQFARLTMVDNSYWKEIFTEWRMYENGVQGWYLVNRLHRENDLPAIIQANGTQEWWLNGQRHRENDLPAVITPVEVKGEYHLESGVLAVLVLICSSIYDSSKHSLTQEIQPF